MYRKYVLAAVIAAVTMAAVFLNYREGAKETVLTAFEKANFVDSSCHIYQEGYLDDRYYMIEEKKTFLEELGALLKEENQKGNVVGENTAEGQTGILSEEHLESGNSIVCEWMDTEGENRIKLTFLTKEKKTGSCEISQENYLRAEIYLLGGIGAGKALREQEKLKETTARWGLEEQVYVEMEGYYEGKMDRDEQRIVMEELLDEMDASRTAQVDVESLYTVYASVDGVDLNLAVTYDEEAERTVFHLGCPVIGTDY